MRFSTPVTRTCFIPDVPSCFIVFYPVIQVTRWSRAALTGWGFSYSSLCRLHQYALCLRSLCCAPSDPSCLQSPVTL
ncbi:hypothetical protein CesoFtcFv8_021054 [Champsocephalus esox]|uniref:Uncharacterized protein n=1 Tax=Champsocephalus esox TaxID=159716 RepID=A0AAN8GKP9_9TELE|nr:hypothetical protein CesoFtcFv8_021054 [Champsocephalus esox]